MDNLVRILRSISGSEPDSGLARWSLTNNGTVIEVKAISAAGVSGPEEAHREALWMLEELTSDGHTLVNRLDFGVTYDPLRSESPWEDRAWRATVDLLLWPTTELTGEHIVIRTPKR